MVLPNGYTEEPRKFTRLLKPPLALLRKLWRLYTCYFDDLITMDCIYSTCSKNMKILKLMPSLVLIVYLSKTLLFLCQEIEYLGFIINSTNMTLTLTLLKKQKNYYPVMKYYQTPILKLWKFHNFWANFPAVSLLSHKENCTIGKAIMKEKQYYGFLCSNS